MRSLRRNLLIVLVLIFLFTFTTTATGAPAYKHVLSSGLFLLPGNAASVDWVVVNNSPNAQTFRVTIYECGLGTLKTAVAPGPLESTLQPGFTIHNANSIGLGDPFQLGHYYEVVVEIQDLKLMPSVQVWEDNGGTVIPGTTILPGNFVHIK